MFIDNYVAQRFLWLRKGSITVLIELVINCIFSKLFQTFRVTDAGVKFIT